MLMWPGETATTVGPSCEPIQLMANVSPSPQTTCILQCDVSEFSHVQLFTGGEWKVTFQENPSSHRVEAKFGCPAIQGRYLQLPTCPCGTQRRISFMFITRRSASCEIGETEAFSLLSL